MSSDDTAVDSWKPLSDVKLEDRLRMSVLDVEELDVNLYRGSNLWRPPRARGVFGGQVLGQGLAAAGRVTESDMHVHSLHSYFVSRGDPDVPIIYHVEKVRDGKSFCTRSISAKQRGQCILSMIVSYHKNEPSEINHQWTMPEVPHHSALATTNEIFTEFLGKENVPDGLRARIRNSLAMEIPVEVKPVWPDQFLKITATEPRQLFWVRAIGHIGDVPNLHRCVAAYVSDWSLVRTAVLGYPRAHITMMASLDHSMWFHNLFHMDDWMLCEFESPFAGGNRGLSTGRIWREDGVLALSVAQEGVIRANL